MDKSYTKPKRQINTTTLDAVGYSYYLYCLETAIEAVEHARALVKDDVVDDNHQLPEIQRLLLGAYNAS